MAKSKIMKGTLAVIAALQLIGCGKLEFSENPLTNLVPIKILKPESQGVEIVSGAAVGQRTVLNGYYVDAAVGAMRDQLETHTPNGYTVFHGVKGSIVSDETTTQ